MGVTESLIMAGIAAAASVGSAAIASSNKPKAPKQPDNPYQHTSPAGPDEARQKLEEEERLRQRRGRASTLLQGETEPSAVATTQSGGKTLLGA